MAVRDWKVTQWGLACAQASGNATVNLALALITPLIEKNPTKTLTTRAKVVLSMTRLIILAFAVAMLKQIWNAGIVGWPEATLCIFIVLANPIETALSRVKPEEVLAFGKALFDRLGTGDVRKIGSVFTPHEWKDGKEDGVA